ncbi:four-carbon acid sugar kinase family protein [Planomicrobium sp. CPCC 101110]|uniref:four-carbon acid sugar kinase family protein n=1 Tax=Planomicrobium sp. CPCC 101110 TaxID=2599619 RepID=UPI0011B8418A|nr:four-carbon acid sugar kinase family protein [Planomicrobium sp. CPCC 101110]TWT25176.1 four-carbon acid sugar kinase family protein [Planomicrobium sp. CPCC 101110]
MATKIGIIADDFTGANDSGVRLAQKGLKSRVLLADSTDRAAVLDADIDVWIVDTESRAMQPKDAYRAVYEEIERLKKLGVMTFYKKVDSTLRGSVAAELKAMQDAAAMDVIFITPSFPSMGRTVEGGTLYVNGIPVSETEFAKDPKTPVLHSYIPDLLAAENIETAVLSRNILHAANPENWVLEQVEAGVKWIVCDIVKDEDFPVLAQIEANLKLSIGWAGSAGMIDHLYMDLSRGGHKNSLSHSIGKVLVVSGSLSGRTQEQLEVLKARPATKMIEIDPLELLIDPVHAGQRVATLDDFEKWDSAVIYVSGSQENREKVSAWAKENDWSVNQTGKGISQGLGHLVQSALHLAEFDAIIMTGGDTAKDICNVLDILDMELRFEVEAGVPLGMVKWNKKELVAITKAGGFGNAGTLANAVDYLKGAGLHASK